MSCPTKLINYEELYLKQGEHLSELLIQKDTEIEQLKEQLRKRIQDAEQMAEVIRDNDLQDELPELFNEEEEEEEEEECVLISLATNIGELKEELKESEAVELFMLNTNDEDERLRAHYREGKIVDGKWINNEEEIDEEDRILCCNCDTPLDYHRDGAVQEDFRCHNCYHEDEGNMDIMIKPDYRILCD